MDQSVEFNIVVEDVDQTLSVLRRGDIAAVGFITRNSISTGLFRLDALLQDIAKSGCD
ncbi:MAG: hypothetical protein ACI8XX_000628 [Polaribacter sp.]|jgi:hypothetical protein